MKTANNDVLVLCSFAEESKKKKLIEHGIRVEQVAYAGTDGRPDMRGVAKRLGELEITSVIDRRRSHGELGRAGFGT